MILTASTVSRDDLSAYLVDTYGAEELDCIKNYSDGFYDVDNYLMLEFGSTVTDNEELKADLELLSAYYRIKETEEHLSKYLGKKQSKNSNDIVKPLATIEKGRIKFKGVNDLSYVDNFYTVGNAKEIYVSNVFYDALSDYAGIERNSMWTFRKELSRFQESKFILLILEGAIKPTTKKGKEVYQKYLEVIAKKGYNFIFHETYLRRAEQLDEVTERVITSGKQLKGITDYSVIFEDNIEEIEHVPLYTSYYAWDYDNECELDPINRLRGVGGEFTRHGNREDFPYHVYIDGKLEKMYPVKRNCHINIYDLEHEGFAYIGDNEYIRCLNASDLQLNGDIVKIEATKFINSHKNAMNKAVQEFLLLKEDEDNMQLNVKTVITPENKMFIKNHLKYFSVNSNGERAVEGLFLLDNDFKIPQLNVLVSDNLVIECETEDLEKKRLGLYVDEEQTTYAYKFVIMYDTETNEITRIRDTVLGVSRRGKKLNPVTLTNMGLTFEQEDQMREMIRKDLINTVIESQDKTEFYKSVVKTLEEGEQLHV
ncbi:hypothetical protein COF68_05670 [Bacillus toyonensis]|uniref:hypothetical protein n=1 Tax=Bacillus toyonensis TaxID=155322 RepID=UPI000BFC6917|nr:hypothetical protein [Bacillus toyonensis]PHE64330.1 hypothetical protein COF68_05670 [Bacillus toyonensis]